jgi:hypothetical protein
VAPDGYVTVAIGPYEVSVALSFGPRITSLRRDEGPDLFAHLDDAVRIDTLGRPPYHFRGGHRLWAAPEEPAITYAPDDHPCQVGFEDETLEIMAPSDEAGLGKQIAIHSDGERLVVEHVIANTGSKPVTVAPWAITQFELGGVAVMPTNGQHDGLQADRSVVLWPYTNLSDGRITIASDSIRIAAQPGPKMKLGVGPNPRRLGYHRRGQLFVKDISVAAGPIPDRGAVGQIFTNEYFCELESVGVLKSLEPGATVTHSETWSLGPCPDLYQALEAVMA